MGNAIIIPLVAAANRGKTQTLNLLAELFIKMTESSREDGFSFERLDSNTLTKDEDNQYAFRVQYTTHKYIVVITTKGDDDYQIREARQFVNKYWSEESEENLFWFLACRTKRSSWNQVVEYENQLSDTHKRYWLYKGNLWTSDMDFSEGDLDGIQRGWNNQDSIRLMKVFNSVVAKEIHNEDI